MLGVSHATSGGVAGLAAGIVLHMPLPQTAALAGLTAGMALLPDLDCHGCAARCLGPLSGVIARVIGKASGGHRRLTHSAVGVAAFTFLAWLGCVLRHDIAGKVILGLLVTIAVSAGAESLRLVNGHVADVVGIGAAAAVIFWGYDLALIWPATLLGCLTHLAGDALTDSGIPFLLPFSQHKFRLLREPFAFSTGTRPELLIVDPLLVISLFALGSWAVAPGADLAVWGWAVHTVGTL